MNAQQQLKEDIVRICRMLHRKNYLAATDGNVSVRLGDRVLTTPSGINKGLMEAYQVITLGGIPTAPYATPGAEEVPEAIRGIIKEYDALLLSRHGAMTVGRDVMDAYNKMEKLEHTARVVLAARLSCPLPPCPAAG